MVLFSRSLRLLALAKAELSTTVMSSKPSNSIPLILRAVLNFVAATPEIVILILAEPSNGTAAPVASPLIAIVLAVNRRKAVSAVSAPPIAT